MLTLFTLHLNSPLKSVKPLYLFWISLSVSQLTISVPACITNPLLLILIYCTLHRILSTRSILSLFHNFCAYAASVVTTLISLTNAVKCALFLLIVSTRHLSLILLYTRHHLLTEPLLSHLRLALLITTFPSLPLFILSTIPLNPL